MVTVPTSYAALIEAMGSGNAQVGFLPPVAYIVAHAKGYADVGLGHPAQRRRPLCLRVYCQCRPWYFKTYYDPATGKDTGDAATALAQFAGKRPC